MDMVFNVLWCGGLDGVSRCSAKYLITDDLRVRLARALSALENGASAIFNAPDIQAEVFNRGLELIGGLELGEAGEDTTTEIAAVQMQNDVVLDALRVLADMLPIEEVALEGGEDSTEDGRGPRDKFAGKMVQHLLDESRRQTTPWYVFLL